jgi:PPOX class probable F420-dependent enzyme
VAKRLADDALQRFLDRPLVATLATLRKDGSVLLSPVWHEWRDGGFNIVIGGGADVKLRHLKRDPRATVAVYEDGPPYTGVELRTTAQVTESDADARAAIKRIAIRYLGEKGGKAYADGMKDDPLVALRLEPGELRSWDYSDDF